MLRNGQAHVHGGLISTAERSETLHFFPKDILRIRTLVFFDVDFRDLASMNDMPTGYCRKRRRGLHAKQTLQHPIETIP